jgi:hypothetical protein
MAWFWCLFLAVATAAAAAAPAAPATRPVFVRPTAENTGPTGELHVIAGDVEITDDGAVLRDVDVRGAIHVRASDVRLLNFKARRVKFFDAPEEDRRKNVTSPGRRNLLIEDAEITNPDGGTGITGGHMTVRRTEVHHMGADAFNVNTDTVLEGNYVHHLGMDPDSHADGVSGTSRDGRPVLGVVIRGNNFDMGSHAVRGRPGARPQYVGFNSNAVIFLGLFGSAERPTIVDGNWLNGGNYTVTSGLPGSNIVYRDNRFGRDFNWGLRHTHDRRQRFTPQNWSGNVWDDSGIPTNANPANATTRPGGHVAAAR